MCGHVGVAGLVTGKEERLFKQLLIVDSLRGEHSTGIASVDNKGEVSVAKQVGDPFQLFDTLSCELMFRKINRVLIGHNRYATTGKVNRRNAHPFEFETLVGAHNGTLTNKSDLEDHKFFDVDSEALYHNIEKNGVTETISKTRGAWALVWWDNVKGTLNFLRNKERPLHLTFSKDGKAMFWASERWMLEAVLDRESYPHGDIIMLKEDTLLTYEIDLSASTTLDKPKVREVKGAAPYVYPAVTKFEVKGGSVEKDKPKKRQTSLGGTQDDGYLGQRNVKFYVVKEEQDNHGAAYLELLDESNVEIDVRLYLNNIPEHSEHVGNYVIGDIMSMMYEDQKPTYKVSPWSVKPFAYIPRNRNGQEISKEDFEKNFHTCGWCSGSISYGEECHIFAEHDNGVLCSACLKDANVIQYTN